MNSFQKIIKEICDENDIKFELLSKDWVIKLSKGNHIEYIVGTRFPNNSYTSAMICNDKYAMYQVLKNSEIPVIEHKLIYSNNIKEYHSDLCSKEEIKHYIQKYKEVVIKDTCGYGGKNVYRALKYSEIKKNLKKIFEKRNTAVICPFLNIEAEYRVICLNGEVKLIFSKERKQGEWKHNLSQGAIAKIVTDEILKKELEDFALNVAQAIGICFGSIDLIKVEGKLMVMEVNSSVCLNKFMEQVEYGREIAKGIYSKAIEALFIY